MPSAFESYFVGCRGQSVAVVGFGVSNRPLVKLLLAHGARVSVFDQKPREKLGDLSGFSEAHFFCGEEFNAPIEADLLFRSPGIHPDRPEIERARANGAVVTSEMDVLFALCPCPVIGVTGSDGKTTTTSLIAAMLTEAGVTVHLGGNIGRPLLADVPCMRPEDVAVVELSSFQLMDMTQSPLIAVLTNVAPNHLDIHKDMDEYVRAKANIFAFQKPGDRLVYNADCALVGDMVAAASSRRVPFSRKNTSLSGFVVESGWITRTREGGHDPLFPVDEIRIPGRHNIENMLAACAAVDELVTAEIMAHTARTFSGVPHRIELTRELSGVRYYNDSIASSPSRTMAGLKAFDQKVILIAGGYDKHIPFDVLGGAVCEHVKRLILIGHTAPAIRRVVEVIPGAPPIEDAGDMETAVRLAHERAKSGDIVLMSPACASFDQYPNFEARGQHFRELVNGLKG